MRKNITVFLVMLGLFSLVYYVWQMRIVNPSTGQGTYAVPTSMSLQKCNPGDTDCLQKNEDSKAQNIKSLGADYARQQCLTPISCKAPDAKQEENAKNAVKKYLNNNALELIKIGGITSNNLLFLCAPDTRCWSVDVRNNMVIKQYDSTQMPTTFPSK